MHNMLNKKKTDNLLAITDVDNDDDGVLQPTRLPNNI
jgi:hypothetical protein